MSWFHCIWARQDNSRGLHQATRGSKAMLSVRQKGTPQSGLWRLILSLCSGVLCLLRVMARGNWQAWHIWLTDEPSVGHMCQVPLTLSFGCTWISRNTSAVACKCDFLSPLSMTLCMVHSTEATWMEVSLQPSADSCALLPACNSEHATWTLPSQLQKTAAPHPRQTAVACSEAPLEPYVRAEREKNLQNERTGWLIGKLLCVVCTCAVTQSDKSRRRTCACLFNVTMES